MALFSGLMPPVSPAEPVELLRCVFADSLVTVSEGGRQVGSFSVTLEFASRIQQPCVLLHAQSQGAIDDSPCGTTVTGDGWRQGPLLISIVLSFSTHVWRPGELNALKLKKTHANRKTTGAN